MSHSTLGEVGGGGRLICIMYRVSPSTLNGGGGTLDGSRGGAHLHGQSVSLYLGWSGRVSYLHHPQSVSVYLGWRWGSGLFVSFTMSLPVP